MRMEVVIDLRVGHPPGPVNFERETAAVPGTAHNPAVEPHPIRLIVTDDLRRSRLTVFFRLLLLIPHAIWLVLWSIAAFFASIANWVVVIVTRQPSLDLHRFLSAFVRYSTHVYAYAFLAANPYPGFTGSPGYPIDVQIEPPARQGRLGAAFRLILALPPLVLTAVLVGTATWNATGERRL